MLHTSFVPAQELRALRSKFECWQSPQEFLRRNERLTHSLTSVQFFNDSRSAFARDAWVGARLASVSTADAVRLCPDEWPDYEERGADGVAQYEITEADMSGRRRGDEYKQAEGRGFPMEDDPVEDWIKRAESVPAALRTAANKKALKGYPITSQLVIYLSFSEYGIRTAEVEGKMHEATAGAKDQFRRVFVLWKSCFYCLWDGGNRSDRKTPVPINLF